MNVVVYSYSNPLAVSVELNTIWRTVSFHVKNIFDISRVTLLSQSCTYECDFTDTLYIERELSGHWITTHSFGNTQHLIIWKGFSRPNRNQISIENESTVNW